MAYNSFQSFVRKNPGLTAAATVALAASVFFVVKSPPTGLAPTGSVIIHQWQTGSGVAVGQVYDSGKTSFSGSTLFADQKTGSGRIQCGGTDGCGLVLNDADGTGCWAIEVNNGTLITHAVPSAECP